MAAIPSNPNDSLYTRIGKYEIQAHIGTGGMGVVYRAVDVERGRDVALKILPADLAAQADKLERFRREARHGIRLRHKNIVQIYDFGEVGGTYFLVLEFVDGLDLHQYIVEHGPLEPLDSCRIVIQALRALNYFHKRGMVHRDVKPSNILLTRQGDKRLVKLADMGLARELWNEEEFRVTREDSTVGTVDYISPEQARDSGMADIRSDIYSLGCTWFHMLVGNPPFASGNAVERLCKHMESEPADVRDFNPRIPEKIAAILKRMLAKKPADRFQTPAELLKLLVRTQRREPSPKPSQPPAKQWPRPLAAPPETADKPAAKPTEHIPAGERDSTSLPAIQPEHQRAAVGQFERAREVLADGNYEYGVHLLRSCCRLDPAHLQYRRTLRKTEKAKYDNNRRGARFAWLTSLPARTRLKTAKRGGEHLKVLECGEEVLMHNPWDVSTQMDMAQAAEELGLEQLAVWLLEEARENDALNTDINRALAHLYEERCSFKEAIAHWELVRKANPTDMEASEKITNLAASDTIARVRRKEAKRRTSRRSGP
jgi:serine/threonine protein kinase